VKLIIYFIPILGIIFLSSLNWHRSVKAVFVLLVLEGAIRKWILPQASDLIYFLKDIVLAGAYLQYYGFSRKNKSIHIKADLIKILISMVAGWALFQAFNPSLGSPIVGLFGLRGYLFYIPLMWMLSAMFQSEDELYKFLRLHLLLVFPVSLLGIAQFFSPASSPLNVYAPGEVKAVATFGVTSAVRVTGTFSYLSGYSVYLLISFALLITLLSIHQSRVWWLASILEMFLVTVNSFMTGARGLVLFEVLFLLGYLGTQALTRPSSAMRLIKKILLPGLVVAIAASIWFSSAINTFWLRTTANQDLGGRIESSFAEGFEFTKYKQLDGYGTGSTHQAAPALRRALDLPDGEAISTYYEGEIGRISLELGPVGALLWYGLRISLTISLWLVLWKLKKPFLRQLALSAFLVQLIQISGPLVFHHTFSVYYWFLSSFIWLLPRLEQIENWHIERQLLQNDNVQSTYLSNSPYQ
jgi:hypothetical protein